ncbi:hypothetical protein L6452_14737 [Arctium lappa]|uniref:Uncharacterized protein n=1 Tax=Arctium lappa TaxID=4217 RepID=A0ACB9CM15_ARCLA|nr:hypothetical protein L6452_14737 [Arctium lappa]
MLRTTEQELAKNKSTILMVRKTKKGKGKGKSIAKSTSKSLKPKGGIKKPKEKKKGRVTSTSGIYVIEANLSTSYTSWVLDTGCGSHIYRNVQELKRTRRLSKGEVNLRVGNRAKMTKAPFVGQSERASDVLGIIHSGVCGPMNIQARGGYRYFITFTDDLSRFGYVYLMRHKSESFEMFKEFQNEVQNQLGKSIKILRSDRGGEHLDHDFLDHLINCGIVSQLTPPGTPQWNGVSEMRNHILLDMMEPTQKPQVIVDPQSDVERQFDVVTQSARRSSRKRYEPERYGFLITHNGDVMFMDDEPTSYQDSMASTDSKKWLEAMRIEMDSMYENQDWNLIDPPNESIRILLATAAYHDYEIWQMDVKTAFLNGKLLEDVYMIQPEGFVAPEKSHMVCKLQRSIYGLKQASRSWNHRFDEAIKEFGFSKNEDEPCLYKKVSGSTVSFLLLYVDDILLIGNDIPTLDSVKAWLGKCFSMKDLGEVAYVLGVRIYRDRSRKLLGLSQSTYIDKVLKRFNMSDSKKGFLPMSHGITF